MLNAEAHPQKAPYYLILRALPVSLLLICSLTLALMACGVERLLSTGSKPQSMWLSASDQEVIETMIVNSEGVWSITAGDQVGGQLIFYPSSHPVALQDSAHLPPRARRVLWAERVSIDLIKRSHSEPAKTSVQEKTQEISRSRPKETSPGTKIHQSDTDDLEISIEELTPEPEPRRLASPSPEPAHAFRIYAAGQAGIWKRTLIFSKAWRPLKRPEIDAQWTQVHPTPVSDLFPRAAGGVWWIGKGYGWLERGVVKILDNDTHIKLATSLTGGMLLSTQIDELMWISDSGVSQPAFQGGCDGPVIALQSRSASSAQGVKLGAEALAFCGEGETQVALWYRGKWRGYRGAVSLPQKGQLEPWRGGWIYKSRGRWHVIRSTTSEAQARHASTPEASAPKPRKVLKVSTSTPEITSDQTHSEMISNRHMHTLHLVKGSPPKHKTAHPQTLSISPLLITSTTAPQSSTKYPIPDQREASITHADPTSHRPHSAWTVKVEETHAQLFIATPHQGISSWASSNIPHTVSQDARVFSTGSLSARDPHRAFSLTPRGELITLTSRGALVGDGEQWRHISAPTQAGDLLGVTQCGGELKWISTRGGSWERRKVNSSTKELSYDKPAQETRNQDSPGEQPLRLEIWSHDLHEPHLVIDWRDQSFRSGRPSLGAIICHADGTLYSNLFWGEEHQRRVGIGLLIINPVVKKANVWERRYGYDGERRLAKTPLLPHSVFNAMYPVRRGELYIATNSGLALVRPQHTKRADQLLVFDEARGWSNELINDVLYEPHASSLKERSTEQIGRVWLATPRGLEVIDHSEITRHRPRLKIRGAASALGRGGEHELWVAFGEKLWRGRGVGDRSWDRFSLPSGSEGLGPNTVRKILVRPQGGLWVITTSGVFLNHDLGTPLLGSATQDHAETGQ